MDYKYYVDFGNGNGRKVGYNSLKRAKEHSLMEFKDKEMGYRVRIYRGFSRLPFIVYQRGENTRGYLFIDKGRGCVWEMENRRRLETV